MVKATVTLTIKVEPEDLRFWQERFEVELRDDAARTFVNRAVDRCLS